MNINYAVVSAFERTKEPETKGSPLRFFTLVLLAVFFLVLMVGLAAGAQVYGSVLDTKTDNDAMHIQTGLIANTIHMNDTPSAVRRAEGPEGPALVLEERLDTGTYETRIYKHEGRIVQEYAIAGRDFNPANSTPLFESTAFDFTIEDQLVSITTDKGLLDVALRCPQGGER